MSIAVVTALLVVVAVLSWVVVDSRFNLPIATEIGMVLCALGVIAAADSIQHDEGCSQQALMVRWALIGGGLFLMLLSSIRKPKRRSDDPKVLDFTAMRQDQ